MIKKKRTAAKKTKSSEKNKRTRRSADDIINLIMKDHKPLKACIKTMKSERATLAKKKSAFKEFVPSLLTHSKPEEKTWYAKMKKGKDMLQEGLEGDIEHSLAERLVDELLRERDNDVFEAKVKVLAELVEHHVEEEEEDMLPDFRKNSDLEEREELGREYLRLKAQYSESSKGEARRNHHRRAPTWEAPALRH